MSVIGGSSGKVAPSALKSSGYVIIRVAVTDSTGHVLHALERQGTRGVVLVVGRFGAPMTSSVALKRLALHLREWPRPLTLVSTDRVVRAAARAEQIDAVPSLDGRGYLHRGIEFPIRAIGRVALHAAGQPVGERYHRFSARVRDILFGPILLAIGVIVAGWAFYSFIYPSAAISLRLASERETIRLKAVAEPALNLVDVGRGRIPGRIVQTEVSGHRIVDSTGRRQSPMRRASGEITLINLTAGSIYLPAGTIAASSDGKSYLTVVDINVPATIVAGAKREEGRLTVAVAAELNGSQGNLGPGNIDHVEGPLMFSLRVEQPGPIVGGTDRSVSYVTSTDQQNLRAELLEDLALRADDELKQGVKNGEMMRVWPLGAQNPTVVDASFDAGIDQEASKLRLDLRVRFFATVFREADLGELMRATLVGDIPGIGPKSELIGDSLVIDPPQIGGVIRGAVAVTVQGSGVVRERLGLRRIRDDLIDMPLREVEAYLDSLDGMASYDLRVWPSDIERTPWLPFRLSVSIDHSSPFGQDS